MPQHGSLNVLFVGRAGCRAEAGAGVIGIQIPQVSSPWVLPVPVKASVASWRHLRRATGKPCFKLRRSQCGVRNRSLLGVLQ